LHVGEGLYLSAAGVAIFDVNRRHLLQAVDNIEHRRNLVEVTEDMLQ
jgi:hypothetical protein